ncbi:MAG: hypothetical protein ICV85_15205 [Tolypothrix sp. T3-bin4]|nr:hypothetical protein [Tolypothrix sp. T3-bin4]
MLTYHRRPVCLSLISTDLPIWSTIETAATLYQKDKERFHLLLSEPSLPEWEPELAATSDTKPPSTKNPRLLWLEISPYRVIITMQENGKLSYRHLWEPGVYGISRYWLQGDSLKGFESLRLRNYTRSLKLEGHPLPQDLRLEYELWSEKIQLGHYVLSLQIHH